MVPAPKPNPGPSRPPLGGKLRLALVLVAVGWAAVFAVALWLDPYGPDGRPNRLGTHHQLGLAPCGFLVMTGKPCPSCGMSTSFALLAHGDVTNSLRANFAGTALALFGAVVLAWCVASAVRGRYVYVRSAERSLLWAVGGFTTLMVVRWLAVVGVAWAAGR